MIAASSPEMLVRNVAIGPVARLRKIQRGISEEAAQELIAPASLGSRATCLLHHRLEEGPPTTRIRITGAEAVVMVTDSGIIQVIVDMDPVDHPNTLNETEGMESALSN